MFPALLWVARVLFPNACYHVFWKLLGQFLHRLEIGVVHVPKQSFDPRLILKKMLSWTQDGSSKSFWVQQKRIYKLAMTCT
jgi:hypothetical protein